MGKAFDITLVFEFLPKLFEYLGITLEILLYSTVLGLVFGLLLVLPRVFHIPVIEQIVIVYVSFIRGTPIIIQLFVVFYGLPMILLGFFNVDISRMDPFYFVIITYTLSHGAIFSEIFRSAILSVDQGQTEAAYAVGMGKFQAFIRIILPQSIRISLPNMANSIIGALKDTSLAFTIGVMDMMGRGETLIASTAHALEVYFSLAIIYYVIVIILEKLFKLFEKKSSSFQHATTEI